MAKTPAAAVKPKAAPKPRKPKNPLAPVTAAERGLLAAVRTEKSLNASALPSTERVVRSAFFRALVGGQIDVAKIRERGLDATGLVFNDRLDLSDLRAGDGPLSRLVLNDAVFEREVSFADAHVRSLYIIKSEARGGIDLSRLKIEGDLWLDQTVCTGGILLGDTTIGGVLSLEGVKLKGTSDASGHVSGISLDATRLIVAGSVFCRRAGDSCFEAEGEVHLRGATLGGTLEFDGAKLKGSVNAQGVVSSPSLNADGIFVKGDVFCRSDGPSHFEADGELRLLGGTIGGQLCLSGARLKGEPNALSGHRMSVGDATVLSSDFEADGSVSFNGAKLTDVFAKGTFRSVGRALDLSDVTMRRVSVALSGDSSGEVVLEGATAETLDALNPRDWGLAPANDSGVKLDLDGFTYRRAEIATNMPVRERTWAKFLFRVPIAENVLEVLDRGFEGCAPKRDHFYPQPFEQAAKVLRDMGHARAADDVAVAKREFERVCKANDGLSRFLALLHMVFFRYGYGPMRAGLWTVFFLFVGWLAYTFFQSGDGGMFVAGSTPWPQACTQSPLALAMDAFLPLVDLHVEDKCRWGETYPGRHWAEGFRIVYSLIGLVFIPMVTLTFAGVFRKD